MKLKKNRPYNHWLKSQGHYLLCFSTSKRSEPIRFACDMRLKTRYGLQATTKIPPILENKNVPILRSQNTQNSRTPLKTGSEQSAQLLFIRQWNFVPIQMDQPKTLLTSGVLRINVLSFCNHSFSYFRIVQLYSRLFCIWKLRIAISRCFFKYSPAIVNRLFSSSISEIFSFREKVEHDRLNSNF